MYRTNLISCERAETLYEFRDSRSNKTHSGNREIRKVYFNHTSHNPKENEMTRPISTHHRIRTLALTIATLLGLILATPVGAGIVVGNPDDTVSPALAPLARRSRLWRRPSVGRSGGLQPNGLRPLASSRPCL